MRCCERWGWERGRALDRFKICELGIVNVANRAYSIICYAVYLPRHVFAHLPQEKSP